MTLWNIVKRDNYILSPDQEERLYFNDLYKTQKEIDAMSDDDIEVLNDSVSRWASLVHNALLAPLYKQERALEYVYRRYKELRKEGKDRHPMWRSRGFIELVCMEIGLPIVSFSTGFRVRLGETSKHLISLELVFDKNGYVRFTGYHRVYKKTRALTPEEQEQRIQQALKELAEKRKASYLRNYEKLGLKKTWLYKKFQDDDGAYKVLGLEMKNKKMPIVAEFTANDKSNKDDGAVFSMTVAFLKKLKLINSNTKQENYNDIRK